jgi:hypothetical protein
MPDLATIKKLATELARENIETEPSIKEVYWVPAEDEIRLIEVDELTISSDFVTPFYFRSDPQDGIPVPCGVALIRPEEVGSLKMPEGWGAWTDAKKLAV